MSQPSTSPISQKRPPNVFSVLSMFRGVIILLILFTIIGNALNLVLPKLVASSIDSYSLGGFDASSTFTIFAMIIVGIFLFGSLQAFVQTVASERIAQRFRQLVTEAVSKQTYAYVQSVGSGRLLTVLTADIDSIKMFVGQAVPSLASSLITIVGASVLLLLTNWRLGLVVLLSIPLIAGTFSFIFKKVSALFLKSREAIDRLNKTINESILGSALIRVLNSQQPEYDKFIAVNSQAKDIGIQILRLFASMIPIVTFVTNLATLSILLLGGHFVITNQMTLGDFAAFTSYLAMLIFPIFVIGFMSNVIGQATGSYMRIREVLDAPIQKTDGTIQTPLLGDITLQKVTKQYQDKPAIKDVSFEMKAGTKTAIVGPTAAGKTQLLYLLTGLTKPDSGSVLFDEITAEQYQPETFHQQVGFVFQDSIIFNMSVRENIAFSRTVTEDDLKKAIQTAELEDFIQSLPQGMDTIISERGSNLSGGQKQRIMLARALALSPRILLLDDFTARVDAKTEKKILSNIQNRYPHLTLVSVTQKLASIEDYEQVVVLMEGELIATGTHKSLLETCPEYVQIYTSQRSTNQYELHAE